MRARVDGLLKRDVFAAALLVAFSRFHNWVVAELARVNEGGRFSAGEGEEAARTRDENLFQTGRL
jgi:hypothetical protein